MVDAANLRLGVDSSQVRSGARELERLGQAGVFSERQLARGTRRLAEATSRQRRFAASVQNAAFQVGDFAVQVGAGTSATQAFAQQVPQLLGGFGVLGAVLGGVAAVAGALTLTYFDLQEESDRLTDQTDELNDSFSSLRDSIETLQTPFSELTETYGQYAIAARRAAQANVDLAVPRIQQQLDAQIETINTLVDDASDRNAGFLQRLNEFLFFGFRDPSSIPGLEGLSARVAAPAIANAEIRQQVQDIIGDVNRGLGLANTGDPTQLASAVDIVSERLEELYGIIRNNSGQDILDNTELNNLAGQLEQVIASFIQQGEAITALNQNLGQTQEEFLTNQRQAFQDTINQIRVTSQTNAEELSNSVSGNLETQVAALHTAITVTDEGRQGFSRFAAEVQEADVSLRRLGEASNLPEIISQAEQLETSLVAARDLAPRIVTFDENAFNEIIAQVRNFIREQRQAREQAERIQEEVADTDYDNAIASAAEFSAQLPGILAQVQSIAQATAGIRLGNVNTEQVIFGLQSGLSLDEAQFQAQVNEINRQQREAAESIAILPDGVARESILRTFDDRREALTREYENSVRLGTERGITQGTERFLERTDTLNNRAEALGSRLNALLEGSDERAARVAQSLTEARQQAQDALDAGRLTNEEFEDRVAVIERIGDIETRTAAELARRREEERAARRSGRGGARELERIFERGEERFLATRTPQELFAINLNQLREANLPSELFAEARRELERIAALTQRGIIDPSDFAEVTTEVQELIEEFEAGAISAETFARAMAQLEDEANDLERAFDALPEPIQLLTQEASSAFGAIITGSQNANEAISGLLESLGQLFIDQAFQQLAVGLFGGIPGAAKGAAFNQTGVIPFASGGIVDRATPFGMSGGGIGVMGEAGPEAILPLRRGAGGRLGVQAEAQTVQLNINVMAEEGPLLRPTIQAESQQAAVTIVGGALQRQQRQLPNTLAAVQDRGV